MSPAFATRTSTASAHLFWWRVLPPLSVIILVLLVWQYLIPLGIVPGVRAQYLGTPSGIAEAAVELVRSGYGGYGLFEHVRASLFRTLAGFLIAASVGVPLGIVLGYNQRLGAFLLPIFGFLRPIPALAFIPIVVIWFGIGEVAKVVIIVLALFPILSISAMQAVRGVGQRKVQAAMALGASRTMIFRRVIFPASLPGIFTSIRVSIGIGVTMLVGAEMIATSAGIAFMAMSASDFLLTNVVIVGALIMATLGYSLDLCARALENRIVHWGGKEG